MWFGWVCVSGYVCCVPSQDRGVIVNVKGADALLNESFMEGVAKSRVNVALHRVAVQAKKTARDLTIYTKPKLRVHAGRVLPPRAMVLVPMTEKITIVKSGDLDHFRKKNSQAFGIGHVGLGDGKEMFLMPHFTPGKKKEDGKVMVAPFVEAFWAVRRVKEMSPEVNCKIEKVIVTTCDVISGCEWLPKDAAHGSVSVPVLLNVEEVQKDQELVLHDPDLFVAQPKAKPVFHKKVQVRGE